MAREGKAGGNSFCAVSEMLKFLAFRELTLFPISKSNAANAVVAENMGSGHDHGSTFGHQLPPRDIAPLIGIEQIDSHSVLKRLPKSVLY